MRKWFFLLPITLILGGILWQPIAGSGSPEHLFLRKEIRDREGRVIFRTERRYRLYYTGELPPPEALRPFLRKIESSDGPPYLLAEGLSPGEVTRFAGLSGVLAEEYWAPRFTSGPAFASLLRRILPRIPPSAIPRLALDWDAQEVLYRALRKDLKRGGKLGGGVVDLATGEVYALVNLPDDAPGLLLTALYPPVRDLSRAKVFGERTGIELRDSPGIYWPSGEILATPLQLVRALAERVCGRAPRLHLFKTPRSAFCYSGDRKFRTEYTYRDRNRWLWLRIWPQRRPRFAIVLAGEDVSPPREGFLEALYRVLYRWLPGGTPGEKRFRGFPDLRGLTLRAALERLPRKGLRIEFEGVGRVVRQWPRPGTPWKEVKTCKLYLDDET